MKKEDIFAQVERRKQDMIDDICTMVQIDSRRGESQEKMPFGIGPANALEKALEICKREIVEVFGEQILDEAGKIERKKLGAIVFREPKKLKNLEQILHPKIKDEILSQASQLERLGQVYFVDIPLFFEKKERYAEFKNVAVIYAPKELLLSRLMSRNALSLEEAKARVELQMDIEQKREMAKFVIDNSNDRENLQLELEKFLKQICAIS